MPIIINLKSFIRLEGPKRFMLINNYKNDLKPKTHIDVIRNRQ